MALKIQFALYLTISLYLVLNQCHFSDAQDPYELSYGRDVLPPVTQHPPTTTTKKSSFFKGIKNWFKGESSSTTPSTIQPDPGQLQPNSLSSPRPPPQSSTPNLHTSGGSVNRDYVNSNLGPGSPPRSPLPVTPSSQKIGAPSTARPPNGAVYPSQLPATRDYSTTGVKPSSIASNPPAVTPSSTLSGVVSSTARSNTGSLSSQGETTRNYLNANVNPANLPGYPLQGMPSYPSRGSQSPERDYVNPNLVPGGSSTARPLTSNTPILKNPAESSTGRRDFVNTTPRVQPLGPSTTEHKASIPQAVTPINPWGNTPQSPSSQRDFVNPNINSNRPQHNNQDFPPLPAPGRPPLPTQHPSRPGSSQRQPGANPSSQTGVSFVPRQPSPGRNTTPKTSELATDDEITTLTETLFTKDVNNQNRHITINYQGKTRSSDRTDEAPNPLLEVNDQALQSPTIAKMRPLFNNYEMDTTVNEHVTPLERKEENDLLDAILSTSVMRQAMLFLQEKGLVTPDPRTHRDLLKTIWFTLYSRGGGRIGSSAFEHIFVSEVKNGTITGLHNWVYYHEEEKQGHIDYKGYIKKLELGNKGAVVKFRFNFNGIEKPVNSMFVGTSPELEMALYTVCFQVRPDKECPILMNGNRFTIQTYTFRYRGKNLIGSAFPEI